MRPTCAVRHWKCLDMARLMHPIRPPTVLFAFTRLPTENTPTLVNKAAFSSRATALIGSGKTASPSSSRTIPTNIAGAADQESILPKRTYTRPDRVSNSDNGSIKRNKANTQSPSANHQQTHPITSARYRPSSRDAGQIKDVPKYNNARVKDGRDVNPIHKNKGSNNNNNNGQNQSSRKSNAASPRPFRNNMPTNFRPLADTERVSSLQGGGFFFFLVGRHTNHSLQNSVVLTTIPF